MFVHTSNLFDAAVGEVKNMYARNNKPMTERLAEGEVAADLARHFIKNTKAAERVQRMADGDMRITDMAYNAIKDLTARMKALGGKRFRDNLTGLEFTYTELREIEKFYEQSAAAASRKNSGEGNTETRYSPIERSSKGKYVQADRRVITSSDPADWEGQIYDYINEKIRNGQDIVIPTDDGDNLTITEKTAWKMGYRNRTFDNGVTRPYNNSEYKTKLNAAAHIDELAKISKRGNKNVPDKKNHDFAQAGFNYRTAYFRDLDNQYYRLKISVGENSKGKTVYNIGQIEKVPFPDNGSKTSKGNKPARGKRNSYTDIISQPDGGVKKFSLKNTPQTESENFKRWFGDWERDPENASKVVNEDGTPMVLYHGTDADFTVFDRTKGRSGMDIQGMFFSPWEIDAGGYGNNVGAYYLNIKNPASGEEAFKALNKFKGQNYAGIKAREYLENQGYDGVNFYDEEFVAFYPTQIKSATDNIGTFDRSNPDIRYSLKRDTPDAEPSRAEENHTPEQLKVMQEYEDAVDKDILEFAKYARANPKDNRTSITLSEVTPKAAADIQRITGIDVEGFEHSIKANTIRHIDDGHGVNGSADRSMSDDNDIARIQYVLDNYDRIELLPERSKEYRDKNQNPTPVVKYSKRVDGTYYAVEAVPDTKKHQLAVITAYKNKAAEQQTVSASNPLPDVRNASADAAYNNSISHSNQKSNTFSENDSGAQPMSPRTADAVRASDIRRYGRDIEQSFRYIKTSGMSESDIKRLSDTTRVYYDRAAESVKKAVEAAVDAEGYTSVADMYENEYIPEINKLMQELSDRGIKDTDAISGTLTESDIA